MFDDWQLIKPVQVDGAVTQLIYYSGWYLPDYRQLLNPVLRDVAVGQLL